MTNPFNTAAQVMAKASLDTAPGVTETAMQNVGGALALSLGLGAAARGGAGLLNLIRRRMSPLEAKTPGAVITDVPYAVEPDEDEDTQAPAKLAMTVTQPGGIPWYYPAMGLAAAGGGLAGWKAIDAVLDKRRQAESDEELADAKSEFEKALLQSSPPRRGVKLSADASPGEKIAAALDELYDAMLAKQAEGSTWGDWFGKLMGGYGFYAAATGLPIGYLAYQRALKTNRRDVLEKAMKRRRAYAYAQRPSEIFAVPTPVPRPKEPKEPKEPAAEPAEAAIEGPAAEPPVSPEAPAKRRFITPFI